MSTLKFLRSSHVPSWSTFWLWAQAVSISIMGLCATVMIFGGQKETGYALGALTLSSITCFYTSMTYTKVYNLISRQNEREYHD